MGIVTPSFLTNVEVRILRRIAPPVPAPMQTVYDGKSKLAICFGEEFLRGVRGKTVADLGCGYGLEVIELAKAGVARAIGVEIEENLLAAARQSAEQEGLADRCQFVKRLDRPVDMVISLDCFEHYADPAQILGAAHSALRPNGTFHITFGPPWYHPWGEHLVELPPWAHVFFMEEAILRWRQLMRGGDATTYADVGLNQMSVARFERLMSESHFQVESLNVVPIRPLRWLHNRFTREFTSSAVRAVLRKPPE